MSTSTGAGEEQIRKDRLHRLFVHIVARPESSYQAAERFLELFPESRDILSSALQTLWDTLSNDGGETQSPASARAVWREARWRLLAQAGMLRGINLGLITSWRPSAETTDELDSLYSGSVACLETLSSAMATSLMRNDVTLEGLQGTRAYVLKVNDRAKKTLTTALLIGYGTAFLISDALDWQPELTEPLLRAPDPTEPVSLAPLAPDDPSQVEVLDRLADGAGGEEVKQDLRSLLEEPTVKAAAEKAMLEISRFHPVAIPRNLPRYSAAFVQDMLAYLLRWWLAVGLRVQIQISTGSRRLPSERAAFQRFAVQRWLARYARRWARSATPQFLADSSQTDHAQEHVLALIRSAVATGYWLALQLEG